MQVMLQIGLVFMQLILLLALSPFIVGVIRKVKARLQCRRGASLLQPYADLAKLFGKPDPGAFDIAKLLPVTYVVASLLMGMSLLLIYADIVKPVNLFG